MAAENLAHSPDDTLTWHIAMGADEAVGEAPTDWATFGPAKKAQSAAPFAPAKETAQPSSQPARAPLEFKKPDAAPPVYQMAEASPLLFSAPPASIAASDLTALRDELNNFTGCSLKKTALNLVFGDGNPASGIMFIGEAPGADEDRQGKPFVGRSGQLLDRMLAAISLPSRDHYYITNLLPWRPPGNRTPTDGEIATCLPFLQRHIALVNPRVIITLGGPATKTILNRAEGITRLRGKWYEYALPLETHGARVVPVLPMLHPAALLRNPAQKRQTWADLLALKLRLSEK